MRLLNTIRSIRRVVLLLAVLAFMSPSAMLNGQVPTMPKAKNVILMLAPGMGFQHVRAGAYYQYGTMYDLPYDNYPIQMGMSTFASGQSYDPDLTWVYFGARMNKGVYVDSKGITYYDSVSTDTVTGANDLSIGEKTALVSAIFNKLPRTVGYNVDNYRRDHLYEAARLLGKKTAYVTNSHLGSDTMIGFSLRLLDPVDPCNAADKVITTSLYDVVMAAGHPFYNDNGQALSQGVYDYGSQLIWNRLHNNYGFMDVDGDGMKDPWSVIHSKQQFLDLIDSADPPNRVMGIANVHQSLQCYRPGESETPFGDALNSDVPSLSQMTMAAVNVIDDDPDGFFMIVSADSVGTASMDNNSARMIEEMLYFNSAVDAVNQWVEQNSSWDETLVIVTSTVEMGYLTGPDSGLIDGMPTWTPVVNLGQSVMPLLQWNEDNWTNSLVPFFAKGPSVGLFYFNPQSVSTNPASPFMQHNFFFRNRRVDPVLGRYLDNTEIASILKSILE